jgi:hypothetical protein
MAGRLTRLFWRLYHLAFGAKRNWHLPGMERHSNKNAFGKKFSIGYFPSVPPRSSEDRADSRLETRIGKIAS